MKQLSGRITSKEQQTENGPCRLNWSRSEGGSEGIMQTGRHLSMKVDFRRVVSIMGHWKECPRLRNEYGLGLNRGRIWYKKWFGLLAMVFKDQCHAPEMWGRSFAKALCPELPFAWKQNIISSTYTNNHGRRR